MGSWLPHVSSESPMRDQVANGIANGPGRINRYHSGLFRRTERERSNRTGAYRMHPHRAGRSDHTAKPLFSGSNPDAASKVTSLLNQFAGVNLLRSLPVLQTDSTGTDPLAHGAGPPHGPGGAPDFFQIVTLPPSRRSRASSARAVAAPGSFATSWTWSSHGTVTFMLPTPATIESRSSCSVPDMIPSRGRPAAEHLPGRVRRQPEWSGEKA